MPPDLVSAMPKPFYERSGITIYHGDCRDILPQLADHSADLVLTDPPYGVGLQYTSAYQDDRDNYAEWLAQAFAEMVRVGALVMLTPGIRNLWLYPTPDWVLCWGKPGATGRSDLGGFNVWEPIVMYGKRRIYNDMKVIPFSGYAKEHPAANHPCPKPLELMRWLVSEGSDEGAVVLDPFMGSGTTLRAAKDLGRKAIGIEIEERYCEIAAKRLAQEVLL